MADLIKSKKQTSQTTQISPPFESPFAVLIGFLVSPRDAAEASLSSPPSLLLALDTRWCLAFSVVLFRTSSSPRKVAVISSRVFPLVSGT
mmetsp:Transcript_89103/g.172604  ORF Transcript_89103/g.172604 Transcript_89103/m.172604 type:complete len:90 (-) Transcript_89103:1741-2010(-)